VIDLLERWITALRRPRGRRAAAAAGDAPGGASGAASGSPSAEPPPDARLGERLAAAHLEARGYRILARNLRVGHDEADLVATPRGPAAILVIVEVKSSRSAPGSVLLRIDAGKQRRLVRLAQRMLSRPEFAGAFVRFDCVGVDLRSTPPRIEHLEGAFTAAWPRG
jgi:putative endonuclease